MPRILQPGTSDYEDIVYRFGVRINAGDSAAILEESPWDSA